MTKKQPNWAEFEPDSRRNYRCLVTQCALIGFPAKTMIRRLSKEDRDDLVTVNALHRRARRCGSEDVPLEVAVPVVCVAVLTTGGLADVEAAEEPPLLLQVSVCIVEKEER